MQSGKAGWPATLIPQKPDKHGISLSYILLSFDKLQLTLAPKCEEVGK
jgi:hypothetical protein